MEASDRLVRRTEQDLVDRHVAGLTDRARRRHAIRPDITGRDVVLLLGGVHQTAAPLLTTEPELWRRYLALVFDGIRADAAEPLPHPAPDMPRFVETDPPPGA